MEGEGGEKRGIWISIIAYAILFALFVSVYLSTHLVVILAEAYDALSDIIISAFLLISVWWSEKPADDFHMFGHGRVQNVGALVAATIFILFLSLETFRQSIPELLAPGGTGEILDIRAGVAVTLLAMLITAAPLVSIIRTARRGAAVRAQLVALVEMELAFFLALVALVLTANGYAVANPLSSLAIGILILVSGLYLLKDNADYLIGKAPPISFLEEIRTTARSVPGVLGVHDLKAEYVGPGIIHSGFHITIAANTSIEKADQIAEEVKKQVEEKTGCRFCVIHVDPIAP